MQIAIGFGLSSHWLKSGARFLNHIATEIALLISRTNCKPCNIWLKTAVVCALVCPLWQVLSIKNTIFQYLSFRVLPFSNSNPSTERSM